MPGPVSDSSDPTIHQQRKGAAQVVDVICSRWLPVLLDKAVQQFEYSVEEREDEWVFTIRLRVPKDAPREEVEHE